MAAQTPQGHSSTSTGYLGGLNIINYDSISRKVRVSAVSEDSQTRPYFPVSGEARTLTYVPRPVRKLERLLGGIKNAFIPPMPRIVKQLCCAKCDELWRDYSRTTAAGTRLLKWLATSDISDAEHRGLQDSEERANRARDAARAALRHHLAEHHGNSHRSVLTAGN